MPRPQSYFGPDGKTPRPELFDAEAQEEARVWTEPATKKEKYEPKIPASQLRRFFGQVMADRRQLELKGAEARDEEAQVAMALLKAGAAYTAAREPDRKPMAAFVAHHAGLVKTVAEFRAFARHFEAVVAWHKVFEKEGFPEASAPRGPGGHAGGSGPGGAARAQAGPGGPVQRPGGGYQGRR